MQFGVALPNFHYGAAPTRDHILAVARAAEEGGFSSVWASDHIIVGTAFPRYGTLYEALTTLAWLGAQIRRVRIGTSVLVLPLRHAILAAKQIATLDDLTGGRVVIAVGVGSNEGEYGLLGADYRRRGRMLDESIRVLRNLWAAERPGFSGEFYEYDEALFFPKPVQPGGPPIWVGGNSDAAIRRTAQFGDGWHADEVPPAEFATKLAQLSREAAAARRTVGASIRYTVDLRAATRSAAPTEREPGMAGSYDGMREFARVYREFGTTDFVCQFEHDTPEQHVEFIRAFGREVIARA